MGQSYSARLRKQRGSGCANVNRLPWACSQRTSCQLDVTPTLKAPNAVIIAPKPSVRTLQNFRTIQDQQTADSCQNMYGRDLKSIHQWPIKMVSVFLQSSIALPNVRRVVVSVILWEF